MFSLPGGRLCWHSCFDLAVVTISHPVLICLTLLCSVKTYYEEIGIVITQTCALLAGF